LALYVDQPPKQPYLKMITLYFFKKTVGLLIALLDKNDWEKGTS